MENNLNSFLSQNAIKVENKKFVASKRFVDKNKKPIEWEIRALTSEEDSKLRAKCMKQVKVSGKYNQYTKDFDSELYIAKLAATCTVYPDLTNAELQDSYKVMGAENLLRVMLTPGEMADYLEKVKSINGYEETMQDLVDEVKN